MSDEAITQPPGLAALWYGLLGGPLVMFIHGAVNFVMVPWACGAGKQSALWLTTALCSLVAISAIFVAFRKWLQAGADWDHTQELGPVPEARFMAILGMAVSGLSLLVILGAGVASLFLGACQ